LRVAIDATPLILPSGGIARYTYELTTALAAEFPADEYLLLSDQRWGNGPAAPNVRKGSLPGNFITRRWWLAGLPWELRRSRANVFHGTDFAVPYLPLTPSVLTLHDLSPWKQGELRAAGARRIRRRTPLLLRIATMIVTPSEAVRREAIEHFHLSPARVAAVPLAPSRQFQPRGDEETSRLLRRLSIARPYLLFVGTQEPRKNLGRLIEAWREVRREHPDLGLVLAGRPGDNFSLPEVLNVAGEPGLTITGRLADADIAGLMSRAALFVYPSLYEGFGLPVLEAMQAGAPVVISRDPALREVAGDAAVSVDAGSPVSLACAIVQLMKDPRERMELRARGRRRAAQFCWRYTAIRTHEIYAEALQRF